MNHTVTLETARKLKEAGIEFEKALYWYETEECPVTLIHQDFLTVGYPERGLAIPAPILTELLERLPKDIKGSTLALNRSSSNSHTVAYISEYGDIKYDCVSENPCEAAAQLLLTLKEKGLLNE